MSDTQQNKSWLMFRILANRFHKKSQDSFFKRLPHEIAQKVSTQDIIVDDAASLITQPEEFFAKVHYSWLTEPFEKIHPSLKPSVLSALQKETAQGIAKITNVELLSKEISTPVKRFLSTLLYKNFVKREILPLSFLPKTTLSFLGNLSKIRLTKVIDYLGLYDLAEELRYTVDKSILTNIYGNLSKTKQRFLRSSMHSKDKLVAARLDLDLKTIDKKKLEPVLHKRGILRLAKALSGEPEDLVWHIAHTLDAGRGRLLLRYYRKDEIPGITPALALQVIHVINFLKKSES